MTKKIPVESSSPRPNRRTFLATTALVGAAFAVPFHSLNAAPASIDTITVGTAVDIVNFDPYAQSINAILFLKLVNAWLIEYDEDLNPIPSALQSFSISDDAKSVTLVIRPDVVFHTGKTMTVEDVVFGFERAMVKETGFNLFAGVSGIVSNVEAVNERTVKLSLKSPTATSLITDMLAHQPVVDMAHNSSEGLASAPASAGPFRLSDWRQGEIIQLEAFDGWYGGAPLTKNVDIRVFTSPAAATGALASGAIDLLAYPQPRDASRLQGDFEIMSGYPGAATMLLRVSTKTAPFDNKLVRQAFQHSIDRDRIVNEVLFGFGGPAYLPFGPKSPVQDPSVKDAVGYDLDKAKALLAEAGGVTNGVALVSGSDPVGLLVMQIIQADLASIGFDLEIEAVDSASFGTRLVSGDFGVGLGQVGGGQLSVSRIVQNSLMRTANNPLWPDGIPPKDYSGSINVLTGSPDDATAQNAFADLRNVLLEESWAIATYIVPTLWAYNPDLKNVARDHQNALVLSNAGF